MSACQDCGKTFRGKQCHCVACHETFSGETSFGLHQGPIAGCYSPPFENSKGTAFLLVQRADGVWARPGPAKPFWPPRATSPANPGGIG